MNAAIEHILLQDQLSEDDLKVLDQACKDDASLAEFVRNWAALTSQIRNSLDQHIPDSRLLVLYALSESGDKGVLTDEERTELDAAQEVISRALAKHSAVEVILNQIRSDAEVFQNCWSESVATSRATTRRSPLHRVRLPLPILGLSVRRISLGLAAVVVVLIASIVVFRPMLTQTSDITFSAQEGKTHVVNLPDGSSVRLMPGSAITLHPDETFDRQLRLVGNAFFDVSPGEKQFQVSTANAVTSVFGTSFGISSIDDASLTEVILVSGSVSVATLGSETDPVMLSPGQYSRVLGTDLPTAPLDVDLQKALAWTNLFIFRDTQLSVAFVRLMESFEVSIVVDDSLAELTITGTFAREQGLESILDAIASAMGVRIEKDSETGSYHFGS